MPDRLPVYPACICLFGDISFVSRLAHLPLTFALEFKGEGVVRETYEMAKQAGILEKCIFTSFQFEDLVELRALDKTVRAGYLTNKTSQENIEKMQSIQLTQACLKAASITEEVVKRHHDAGFSIRAWGIDSAETMQHVIDCGVDAGMTINFPDVLTRALCQMQ